MKSGAALEASYTLDALGRVVSQTEYSGGSAVYSKTTSYDADSNVVSDSATTVRSGGTTVVQSDTYTYTLSGAYQGGALVQEDTATATNGGAAVDAQTVNDYVWRGGAALYTTYYTPNTAAPDTYYTTLYTYRAGGALKTAAIQDGTPRTVTYTTNVAGEILGSVNSKGPTAFYDFFDGVQEGVVG